MTAFESQMAAQRSLMTDSGLGMNTGQSDGLMHHPLAMVQNQNRKSFFQLSLFQPSTLNCLWRFTQYLVFPNRTGRALYYQSSYYDLNFTMQRVELQFIGSIKSGGAGQILDQIANPIQAQSSSDPDLIRILFLLCSLRLEQSTAVVSAAGGLPPAPNGPPLSPTGQPVVRHGPRLPRLIHGSQ